MLEILLCSMVTILPDYLFRRYAQGKRFGHEITLFSVWFELRWGIVTCLLLAISLITAVFYFHPTSVHVSSVFRTVPIVPQINGRVAEIYVRGSEAVEAGAPLFRLADETQRTAVEVARRAVAEVDAARLVAQADLAAAEARILEAQAALQQTADELAMRRSLGDVAARREVERLQVTVRQREAGVAAAQAAREAVAARLSDQLPAERASALAALAQAEAELDKTIVRAGVSGRVEQFLLQVGDVVNPFARPAGVLVPEDLGQRSPRLAAGFGQIEARVLRVGMLAEASCASLPWTVIPMVVTGVQPFVASGQVRGGDVLLDAQQFSRPGTVLAILEPLYPGGLDQVIPGSNCFANAYTSNHEALSDPATGTLQAIALHGIDAVGLVHAILLRIQTLMLPFKALVFSGH
ncbi:HlyD family secretion protein [Roseococcus sp. SDR]|uniref:HlyD family secretion protein n=1 Tax=Roseococcus sp. SDR TaxID=2835532 RepID=UPI001BCD99F6|nr:HlyD family secretion protein [Roseococcus sp. SDR]MBS7790518.1 HlyD family secretion protein [Roseococcus sp. SDR]MBV1845832.1 HlyD family secretion protein [Roseococcus sp. SDR]